MSEQFKDYVTGGAFQLSLSKRQVEMLSHLDQFGASWGSLHTAGALIAKGLAERAHENQCVRFRLTEAGRAVIPLLKLSGLYVCLETPDAVEVAAAHIGIRREEAAAAELPA